MLSRRAVIGALVAGGGGLIALEGTGAVSAIIGDRSFSVGTADDRSAMLRIETFSPTGEDGETVPILRLTNQLGEPLDEVEVVVLPGGNSDVNLEDVSTPRSLRPGRPRTITADIACDGDVDGAPVEVRISVAGPTESITVSRELTVACHVPDEGKDDDDRGGSKVENDPDDDDDRRRGDGGESDRDDRDGRETGDGNDHDDSDDGRGGRGRRGGGQER